MSLRTFLITFGLVALTWLSTTGVAADEKFTTVGGEFQVNSYTSSSQTVPAVAKAPNGDFMVVWASSGSAGTDSDAVSIQGQLYASDGSEVGGEFQVNTNTVGTQWLPDVSGSSSGFVVVWRSDDSSGTDTSGTSIAGQRYATDGTVLGGEFQVNTYTTSTQNQPAIAANAAGDFVVVWHGNNDVGVRAQRFASDGSPLGAELLVDTYTTSAQGYGSVAVDESGNFVVVWESEGSLGNDASDYSVQGQRFASDGSRLGGQFQINTYTTNYQDRPMVAATPDGDFVVVWASYGSTGTDSLARSIQGQRFASDGSTLGGEFQVNTYTTEPQFDPAVAIDDQGNFTVVWQSATAFGSNGPDGSSSGIQGQRFAADGSALGGEFQVNSYTTAFQTSPRIVADANELVMVWQSYNAPEDPVDSIRGQRFTLEADLSITKDDGVTTVDPGGQVTYTIVASNVGPDAAPSVTVTDIFPAGLTCSWMSVAVGGASGNTDAAGDLMDTLMMPAGSMVTYTATCDVALTASGTLSNTATISSPLTDATPGNNSATDDDTVVTGQAALSLAKTGLSQVGTSEQLVYTLTVDNDGPLDATTVTLVDTLPAGTTYVSAVGTGWACGHTSGTVTCTLATLVDETSSSVDITVTTPASPETILNMASVSASEPDFDASNDSASYETAVVIADLFSDGFESGNTSAWSNSVP